MLKMIDVWTSDSEDYWKGVSLSEDDVFIQINLFIQILLDICYKSSTILHITYKTFCCPTSRMETQRIARFRLKSKFEIASKLKEQKQRPSYVEDDDQVVISS